jgi:hypothetical protein
VKVPTILWVSPYLDEWRVVKEGMTCEEGIFDGREDAIEWACRVAQRRMPCLVRVQDYGGNITAQFAFGLVVEDEQAAAAAA